MNTTTHLVDYHVGAKLFVPSLFGGDDGCFITIVKVEDNLAHIESSPLLIDCTTNRTTSGYRQMVYSSKEQYQQIRDAYKS